MTHAARDPLKGPLLAAAADAASSRKFPETSETECPGGFSNLVALSQRVHVLLYDILWPERAVYMGTLGPKYLICGYLDPWGLLRTPYNPQKLLLQLRLESLGFRAGGVGVGVWGWTSAPVANISLTLSYRTAVVHT